MFFATSNPHPVIRWQNTSVSTVNKASVARMIASVAWNGARLNRDSSLPTSAALSRETDEEIQRDAQGPVH